MGVGVGVAALEPPTPELAQVLGAVHGNQEAMDRFVRVAAGVTSPAEFFSEENVGELYPRDVSLP